MNVDAILLIGYGGPTAPDEIWPFLTNIANERSIPLDRLSSVHQHYLDVGGFSPFNALTFQQADALQAATGLPVYVGLRNWEPYIPNTVRKMKEDGIQRIAGIVLAPHRSNESFDRYKAAAVAAVNETGGMTIDFIAPWHLNPGFLEAQTCRIEQASGYRRGEWPGEVPILFTAHSIPTKLAEESRYAEEIQESAEAVAGILGVAEWRVAYQSRSGNPATPWLEPSIDEVVLQVGKPEVVVVPIGFVCDNVEVLYDLDIQAKAIADTAGIKMVRAGTVGDSPAYIQAMANAVRAL